MKMVQRKVTNKLGIQAVNKNTFKTDKKQPNTKSCVINNNHDGKPKIADLKAKKMKKTRSIKQSELVGSPPSLPKTREVARKPEKQSPPCSPTKTPSPKKPAPCKSTLGSPNYMKSTSSSLARKEQSKVNISSTTNVKSLGKMSSLKKMRALTKTPSFKHTRSGGNKRSSKVILYDDFDPQKATCSSTLKDSKFPTYLRLNPGATEAEGSSAMKVCPYNYCSLNGHHHKPVPPLRSFLSSKRRLMKTQRVVKPKVLLSPSKAKPLEKGVKGLDLDVGTISRGMPEKPEEDEFFVEIYVQEREIVDVKHGDQSEDSICISSDMNSSQQVIKGVGEKQILSEFSYNESTQEAENCTSSISLDDFFGENPEMEWEEGKISSQDDVGDDQKVLDYDSNSGIISSYLEELAAKKLLSIQQDEITEWQQFSDTGFMSDSDSTQQGEEQTEEPYMTKTENYNDSVLEDDETVGYANAELKPCDEQVGVLPSFINETIEVGSVDLDYYQDPDEINEDEAEIGEHDEYTENDLANIEIEETVNNDQAEFDIRTRRSYGEQDYSSEMVQLNPNENDIVGVKTGEIDGSNKTGEIYAVSEIRAKTADKKNVIISREGTEINQELAETCKKLRSSKRSKKVDEESEEGREFNPRGPNFLPIEPEQEGEKVDLRHQDMDERRNAEDWMLDHALQKTVNQLGPARKRKVALLVEAFESVLPIPKWDSHLMRRNSSGFGPATPIQACS